MSDSPKLSRREWFRLRVPHQNRLLDDAAQPTRNDVLKPIEHPPNHDGLDLSELPPMREALLTIEQVEELFTDIRNLATDVLLMQRSTGAQRATASRAETIEQLVLAKTSLLSGRVKRVQIRYRWQDSLWIDTLSSQPEGYRLIRIAHRT